MPSGFFAEGDVAWLPVIQDWDGLRGGGRSPSSRISIFFSWSFEGELDLHGLVADLGPIN
jgi:hypothetical protein